MVNAITVRKMIYEEARECVAKINANLTDIRHLVLELYEREGWTAMGYASWRECVTAEFESKQSYHYYLLEAARTEKNISTLVENAHSIPETHLRPLTKLRDNPEAQKEAWQRAVENVQMESPHPIHVINTTLSRHPHRLRVLRAKQPFTVVQAPAFGSRLIFFSMGKWENRTFVLLGGGLLCS